MIITAGRLKRNILCVQNGCSIADHMYCSYRYLKTLSTKDAYVSYLFNFDITFIAFCLQFNWLRRDNMCTGKGLFLIPSEDFLNFNKEYKKNTWPFIKLIVNDNYLKHYTK